MQPHARVKRGGQITVEYLDPIPPGLDREEFARLLEDRLETATDELVQSVGGPATERPVTDGGKPSDAVGERAVGAADA